MTCLVSQHFTLPLQMLVSLHELSAAVKCPVLYQTLTSQKVRQSSDHQRLSLSNGTQEPCGDSWGTEIHLQELEERLHVGVCTWFEQNRSPAWNSSNGASVSKHESSLQPSAFITLWFVSSPSQYSIDFQSFATGCYFQQV